MPTERGDGPPWDDGQAGAAVIDRLSSSPASIGAAVDMLDDIAAADPEEVGQALDALGALVTDPPGNRSIEDRIAAVRVLAEFATLRPDHAAEAVSSLEPALDEPTVETPAFQALAAIAAESPAAVDPLLDAVGERLTAGSIPTRCSALGILEYRADVDPVVLVPLSGRLVDVVTSAGGFEDHHELPDHQRSRQFEASIAEQRLGQRSAALLDAIARAEPRPIGRTLDRLAGVLAPGNRRNHALQEQVVAIVETVAEREPEHAVDVVDELVDVVEDGDAPVALRAAAARTLATLADHDFDATTRRARQAVPALADLLTRADPTARATAVALLSYVAQRDPAAVAPLTGTLVDRLADEQVATRAGAVWTLGYVDTERARDALRTVAATDPDSEVRALAADRRTS